MPELRERSEPEGERLLLHHVVRESRSDAVRIMLSG